MRERAARKAARELAVTPSQPIDMSGIVIEVVNINGIRMAVVRLEDRSDVPPLHLDFRSFSSGQKLREFAHGWALQHDLKRA